jgi:hypothetical protein
MQFAYLPCGAPLVFSKFMTEYQVQSLRKEELIMLNYEVKRTIEEVVLT